MDTNLEKLQAWKNLAFKTSFLKMKEQGWKRSIDEDLNRCLYNGPNNIVCAAAALIQQKPSKA